MSEQQLKKYNGPFLDEEWELRRLEEAQRDWDEDADRSAHEGQH